MQQRRNELDKLEKDIYTRNFPDVANSERASLTPERPDDDLGRGWKHDDPIPLRRPRKPGMSAFKKIFIGAVIFFVISVGVAAFIFFRGLNVVSADNVNITFLGPVSIAAGDELDFNVVVENDNTTALQNVVLYLDYATGTKETADVTQDLLHDSQSLADIPAGQSGQGTFHAVLFGQAHDIKEMTATVEYTVANSNGTYRKQKTYDVEISSAPVIMTVNTPEQSVSGEPMETTITVTSNSSNPLPNLLLTAEYPFGYTFSSSTPAPSYDNDIWLIKNLDPGQSQSFAIDGSLQGQNNDQSTFHFSLGAEDTSNAKLIATNYLSDQETTELQRPPVSINLSLNTNNSTVIAPGTVESNVTITNNMATQFINGEIDIAFSGAALDPSSPTGGAGVYRVSTQTLTFDKTSLPGLTALDPGQSVGSEFTFATLPANDISALKSGSITVQVSVKGTTIDPSTQNTLGVASNITQVAKIQSSAGIIAKTSYSTGPFKNTGPIPPKVDTKTTYTVALTLTNSSNVLSNSTLTANLPPYVQWVGTVSPSTENVTYDSQSNTVTWQVGDLAVGGTSAVRQVYFQLAVDPTISQVSTAPDIFTNISFQGTDTFAGTTRTATIPNLTTALTADPNYSAASSGIVH